ncbi:hypothetical protein DAI22_02g050800 [Oryza sativa Japonica Group]|nr:hypothetical protein DAI22_02g050800 [Oryza sativa Japonica Group]
MLLYGSYTYKGDSGLSFVIDSTSQLISHLVSYFLPVVLVDPESLVLTQREY